MRGRGSWASTLVLWALLVAGGLGAAMSSRSPGPAGLDAPDGSFSADRAWVHLEEIARAPHPVGSDENDRVREYLTSTLETFGYDVDIQSVLLADHDDRGFLPEETQLDNVLVRLEGTDNTGAVMLATHYDSVWVGPGATDAGVSVAALVETARALTESAPLRNDVIILLTDAEEVGLVGARAFVDEHPWATDVELVLNFEGRGTSGPAVVYELVEPTTSLIGGLVRHAPNPVTSPLVEALAQDDYRRRISDLGEYRRLGISAIGFAIAGGSHYYHTPLDDLDHASPSSLQHMGETALSLARHFGGSDLATLRDTPEATWWTGLPGAGLAAPSWVAWPMLALLLAITLAIARRVRTETSLGDVALAFGALAGTAIVATLCGALGVSLVKVVSSDARTMLTGLPVRVHQSAGDLVNGPVFMWAFVAAAAAASVAILTAVERRVGGPAVVLAATISGLLVLTGLSALHLPSAAYLLIPFLCAATGGLLWVTRHPDDAGIGTAAALGLLGVPAVATFISSAWLGYQGLTLNNVGQVTGTAAVAAGSLVPHLLLSHKVHRWLVAGALAAVAAVLLVAAILGGSIDADLVRWAREAGTGH